MRQHTTRNALTFPQRTKLLNFITPMIEPVSEGYCRYKDGAAEPEIAAAATEALGFPVTASNVKGTRMEIFGNLIIPAPEPLIQITEEEFADMKSRICALETLTQQLRKTIEGSF
jgi:hypothetical protein